MNTKLANNTLADASKVWIYQADRELSDEETSTLEVVAKEFASLWTAHNAQLKASATVLFNRVLVLMVDESLAGASGCSIDKSVDFVMRMGQQLGVDFFNRMLFSFYENNKILTLPRREFKEAYQSGRIKDDTLVLDTLVKTKGELESQLLKPLENSWLKRMV